MLTKTVLTADDIGGMLAAVLEYNRKGPLVALTFHGADGQALSVAWVEAVCEERGLAVRSAPEPTADELGRLLNPPVADPRKVPAAAGVGELQALNTGA